ncbi:MAG: DUF1273 family protein [Clostridia bacterium]|nr:DUF1273 family protein [Clostridia bacterium]
MMVQTCCFTGHRVIPSGEKETIRNLLETAIEKAIQDGYRFFGAGGALGFDTLAAQTVLTLKQQYPHIRLILVLPCINQANGWKQADIDEYERIKSLADKVVYTSTEYTYGCMHKRNRHLVDNSSLCICYLTKVSGGTAYTVRYAESKKISVFNLADR